jgi:hypothetical protein
MSVMHGRGTVRSWMLVMVSLLAMSACIGRVPLDKKPVRQMSEAERKARSRMAYERARERAGQVQKGMSTGEVQVAMGAVIAVEEHSDGEKGGQRKLMDGFLCKVNPTPLKDRWLFGYDDGNVELVGFVVEFERADKDDDDWTVKRIDRAPQDDCPVVGDTSLD